jgi:hypothetical protein
MEMNSGEDLVLQSLALELVVKQHDWLYNVI